MTYGAQRQPVKMVSLINMQRQHPDGTVNFHILRLTEACHPQTHVKELTTYRKEKEKAKTDCMEMQVVILTKRKNFHEELHEDLHPRAAMDEGQ